MKDREMRGFAKYYRQHSNLHIRGLATQMLLDTVGPPERDMLWQEIQMLFHKR